MYMRDLWASLARHLYLVLACLLATAGLSYYAASAVPATYESRADVVLVPPMSVEDPTFNRYLSLSGLLQAVDVLTRSLGSDGTEDAVERIAPDGKFETVADAATNAPILIVTASAATPAKTQKLLDAVLAQVPLNLAELQESVDIDKKYRITPQLVSSDEKPRAVHKKQIRAVGAIAAIALLMSALVVGAIDNRQIRRAKARESAEQESIHLPRDRPRGKDFPKTLKARPGVKPAIEPRKRDVVSTKARR